MDIERLKRPIRAQEQAAERLRLWQEEQEKAAAEKAKAESEKAKSQKPEKPQ